MHCLSSDTKNHRISIVWWCFLLLRLFGLFFSSDDVSCLVLMRARTMLFAVDCSYMLLGPCGQWWVPVLRILWTAHGPHPPQAAHWGNEEILPVIVHPQKQTWNPQELVVCRCFSFSKWALSGSMFGFWGCNGHGMQFRERW